MTCAAAPEEQPSLFTDLEAPTKHPGRRNPPRKAASRQRELQVHLPIVQGEAAELLRMEDLVLTQRPLKRGDCQEEARPCPWVSCHWHVYYGRFEEFEAIIDAIAEPLVVVNEERGGCSEIGADSIGCDGGDHGLTWPHPRSTCQLRELIPCEDRDPVVVAVADALIRLFEQTEDDEDGRAKRPKTPERVASAVHRGRAMFTSDKGGRVRSDVLSSSDVRGPWPTCALDIAEQVRDGSGDLEAEDTGRVLSISREAVRQIEVRRARREFARDEKLRPWLTDFVDEDQLDEIAWFGDE